MRSNQSLHAIVLIVALSILSTAASAERYVIEAGDDHSLVHVHSKATLESFDGEGQQLSGFVDFDPADVSELQAELSFDLASLDTGLALRNKHMRENVLHTDQHPIARFVGNESDGGSLVGGTLTTKIRGVLSLHGVDHPAEADVEAELVDGVLVFEAKFTVRLKDHDLKPPRMLMMKVAKQISITVRAHAKVAATLEQ